MSARRLGVLGLLLAAAALAFGLAVPAQAAGTIGASPNSDLADGQFIKISLSGFPSGYAFAFRQCTASPQAIATDCTAVNSQVTAITDSTGAGDTYLPVYAGSDLALTNAGNTDKIACDVNHACVVAAMHDLNDLSKALFVPIAFATSPENCPPPGPDSILGGGSATAYRAMYRWEAALCVPPQSIGIDYALANSVDGINNFFSGLTDFGVTGPLPPGSAVSSTTAFAYAPISTSAVVLAYRIYDRTGPQISNLVLDATSAARIFEGKVANWNVDPGITGLNPNTEFPSRIVPFARAEHSAETYVFTSWLAANAPSAWTGGAQAIFPFPPSGVTGVTGSPYVGLKVVDPTTDFFGQGNIGFMDASTAAFYGLPTAQLVKADGSTVTATPDSIHAAIAAAKAQADGTISIDYKGAADGAYPMPMPSYMLAPTGTIPANTRDSIKALLKYAIGDGQNNLTPGYAPLPSSLAAYTAGIMGEVGTGQRPVVPASPTPSPSASTGGHGGSTPTPRATVSSVGSTPLATASSGGSNYTQATPASRPSPTACPSRVVSGARANCSTATGAAPPLAPAGAQGPELTLVSKVGDWSGTGGLLPSLIALALVATLVGLLGMRFTAPRRGGDLDGDRRWP